MKGAAPPTKGREPNYTSSKSGGPWRPSATVTGNDSSEDLLDIPALLRRRLIDMRLVRFPARMRYGSFVGRRAWRRA
jgi:hypothetical protein